MVSKPGRIFGAWTILRQLLIDSMLQVSGELFIESALTNIRKII